MSVEKDTDTYGPKRTRRLSISRWLLGDERQSKRKPVVINLTGGGELPSPSPRVQRSRAELLGQISTEPNYEARLDDMVARRSGQTD